MSKYLVMYANGLDESGCTCEFPTDAFDANGAELVTYDFVESEITPGADFAEETWCYEVPDGDDEMFEVGLDRMLQNDCVLSWKKQNAEEDELEPES